MKILKWLVFGLVLASIVGAVDFPGPFADTNRLVIVVADQAPPDDIIAATDVATALGPNVAISSMKLASEINDITNYNSILLGSPCYHPVINQLMGYPERCQISGIKLIKHSNGNVALVIMGQNSEIRQLARNWISGASSLVEIPALPVAEVQENYDSCVSDYEEKAREYETWRQNMPEGKRIREEGLRVCGERFGRPVPPALVETEFDRCMNEGHPGLHALPESEVGAAKEALLRKCEPLRPVPREESAEYKACMENLNVQKQELNKKYTERGVRIPDDVMKQYQQMSDRCLGLLGWTIPPPSAGHAVRLGEFTLVRVNGVEYEVSFADYYEDIGVFKVNGELLRLQKNSKTELADGSVFVLHNLKEDLATFSIYNNKVERVAPPTVEPVEPLPPEKPCVGCKKESMCLQFGIRLVDESNRPVYCDFDGFFKAQKQLGEDCQNNYECLSNSCSEKCISYEERIEAVERELKEQRGLIDRMWGFFKRLFGG